MLIAGRRPLVLSLDEQERDSDASALAPADDIDDLRGAVGGVIDEYIHATLCLGGQRLHDVELEP